LDVTSFLHPLQLWLRRYDPRLVGAVAVVIPLLLLLLWVALRSRQPSREERERLRRERLAKTGRITDGSLVDARTLGNEESSSPTPEVLVYRYRLAGVTYECAQDVSRLPELARGCHVGNSVQVRYDPRNPGDSILLAETWSGLWLPVVPQRHLRPSGEPLPDQHAS